MKDNFYFFFFLSLFIWSCNSSNEPLPILSKKIIENGEIAYEKIPSFSFVNQDSNTITNQNFEHKIYVADFFFTHCPTICPLMTQQMLRIHEHFLDNDYLHILSHTIDPKRDTVLHLKHYAKNIGAFAPKWHFVTGDKDELYDIADHYYNKVVEDQNLPDGFDHSGRFILVDEEGLIRAYCNGTSEEEVSEFIEKIEQLIQENAKK